MFYAFEKSPIFLGLVRELGSFFLLQKRCGLVQRG